MSAKTSAARRAAFFAAMCETGNQTIAAERAKVSRSWVSLHRASDPAFRAELEAAITAAKARLREAGEVGPARKWRALAGEELIVRRTQGRGVQVARARLRQWTPRVEKRFLDALAGCCCVKTACRTVGLSPVSAYGHAARWPAFKQRWDEALEIGYDGLQFAMVEQAGRMLDPDGFRDDDIVPDVTTGPTDFHDALQLLKIHQFRVHGTGKPCGRRRRPPRPLEEVRASILRKLEAIEGYRRHQARLAGEEIPAPLLPAPVAPAPSADAQPARAADVASPAFKERSGPRCGRL